MYRPIRLLLLCALAPFVLGTALLAQAKVHSAMTNAQAKRPTVPVAGVGAARKAAAGPAGARLDMLTRLQSVAVQTGDPVQIANTSREMNAELLNLLSTIAAGENRTSEAIDLGRQSLQLHEDEDVTFRLALLLARSGQTEEAIRLAQRTVAAQPQNARAYTTLASVLRAARRDRDAVEPLTRALALDSDPSIAFGLGSALLAVHDKARAEQIFQRLLAASDGAAIWHVAIGDAYREADYLNEAAAEFRAALAKDPHATHAEFFLGLVSLQMNEWGPSSESFTHLRRSVEQNPHEYLSNFYLGALESTDGSDLASSDRHLHTAAEANPSQPEVWIYLGQNAQREHHNPEAIAFLRKAVQLTGSDESRNHFQIRRAYFSLGRLLIADGKREEGEKYLADYRRTGAADAAFATASIAAKQGRTDGLPADQMPQAAAPDTQVGEGLRDLAGNAQTQAAATPTAAAQDLPTATPALRSTESQLRTLLASGYNDLGTAEARQQQFEAALHDFQQAERFGTPTPALLHNTAAAAFGVNDTPEVARALSAYFATTPSPQDPRARLMLGMANFDLGRFGEAARSFQAAGDAALADPRTTYSYAFSLARDGQAQQATALADRLAASGLPPNRLVLVCNVYFLAENYAGSLGCYQRVAQQDPTQPRTQYFIGESLIHLDRPAEAIPALRAELTVSAGEPNVESALAFALAQTGQKQEALTMLERTVAAHPETAEAQYQLGKLLAEQGKTSEALPHLQASVDADPSKDYAHYQLATALRKAGRSDDATREFARYREIKDRHRNDRAAPAGAQPAQEAAPN